MLGKQRFTVRLYKTSRVGLMRHSHMTTVNVHATFVCADAK